VGFLYAHLPQNEAIGFEERSYSVTEGLLDFEGGKILYLLVDAADVTFCDRSYASHLASINVKGYVTDWKYGVDESGQALSLIEPVENEASRREISGLLRAEHNVSAINFL
jgi:hypothetical protein